MNSLRLQCPSVLLTMADLEWDVVENARVLSRSMTLAARFCNRPDYIERVGPLPLSRCDSPKSLERP